MGWKSTVYITRAEALQLIAKRTGNPAISNKELEDKVEDLGYGDNPDWEYFGHNFIVVDKEENKPPTLR